MSHDRAEVGRLIGEALVKKAQKPKPQKPVSVKVDVSTEGLAAAMRDGANDNAQAILGAINVLVKTVGAQLSDGVLAMAGEMPDATDMQGVEQGLRDLADALGDETVVSGLDAVVEALQGQTAAIEAQSAVQERQEAAMRDQIAAIEENTAAIRADRTVSYDGEGRISKMRVIK